MKRNYLIAFVLSFAVLWGWQYLQTRGKPPAPPAGAPAAAPEVRPEAPSLPVPRREKNMVFEIGDHRVTLNRFGGAATQWEIREPDGSGWLSLVPLREFSLQPLSTFPELEFEVSRAGSDLVLTARRPDGLRVEKTYSISPRDYQHRLTVRLENSGTAAVDGTYAMGWGPGVEPGDAPAPKEKAEKDTQRALAYERPHLRKLKAGAASGAYAWWGVDGHYFLGAFTEPSDTPMSLRVVEEKGYFAVRKVVGGTLEPGQSRQDGFTLYLGPKSYRGLKARGLDLEKSVDFGMFAPLGRVIHQALYFFQRSTGNYGWAIVILTSIIQVLVLPLTVHSFRHGQKMKTIQPQMKRIQELYKADPRRQQEEMMALYKRHGLKFMGMEGCLPILIQMPVFFALFSTLRNSFELRHAPWIGWVRDLSAHDPYYVLPILMGGGMFYQQKMSLSSVDPSQRQIMYFMPIIFTVMFLKMPSGLVLYWLTNSVLSIAVQLVLTRRHAREAKK